RVRCRVHPLALVTEVGHLLGNLIPSPFSYRKLGSIGVALAKIRIEPSQQWHHNKSRYPELKPRVPHEKLLSRKQSALVGGDKRESTAAQRWLNQARCRREGRRRATIHAKICPLRRS